MYRLLAHWAETLWAVLQVWLQLLSVLRVCCSAFSFGGLYPQHEPLKFLECLSNIVSARDRGSYCFPLSHAARARWEDLVLHNGQIQQIRAVLCFIGLRGHTSPSRYSSQYISNRHLSESFMWLLQIHLDQSKCGEYYIAECLHPLFYSC